LWVGFDQAQEVFGQSCFFVEVLLAQELRSQDGNASQPRQPKANSISVSFQHVHMHRDE
jgi:hypothetical protein